jgi:hypothetical protein
LTIWPLPYQLWPGVGRRSGIRQAVGVRTALTTSQENGAVKVSCLVSDLCFDWRLRPSGGGTEVSVHVEIPDREAHRLDAQRAIIRQSVVQLAELAVRA